MSNKITPFIRCMENNGKAQAEYYCNIFPDAKITKENPVVVEFEIFGQNVATINGGQNGDGKLNPSISFSLWIKDKDLTKQIWDKLADGGTVMMPFDKYMRSPAYGRCNDKYGVSRQVMYDDRPESATAHHNLVPSLLFVGANAGKAQEAMDLYTSIFPAGKIDFVRKYEEGEGEKVGNIAHAEFKLANQQFIIADSGLDHKFQFNDGVSLSVSCADQAEVDSYRNALIADGGSEVQCGWCKDKYGVSRQITPVGMEKLLFSPDKEKSDRAMQAMLQMKKLDIAQMQKAYDGIA